MDRSWILRACAAATLAWAPGAHAAATPSAAPSPSMITNPDFARRPKPEEMAQAYPKVAIALGMDGWAEIKCSVSATGELVGCQLLEETPKNLGFGKAALSLAPTFQMRPKTRDGKPVDGGVITIPLAFRMPGGDPPPPPPEPTTPQSLDKGRALVDAMGLAEHMRMEAETEAGRAAADEALPPASRSAAAEALRKAVAAHLGDVRDAYALAMAAVFSDQELEDLAAFQGSVGKALLQHPELSPAQAKITDIVAGELGAAGHAQFCAKRTCPAQADLDRVLHKPDPDRRRIDNPVWDSRPSPGDIRDAAPALATQLRLAAAVRMTCAAQGDGRLKACHVDEELPDRMGFGRAALDLASAYRLEPKQEAPGGGRGRVTVRLAFTPTEAPAPVSMPPPKSAASLQAARELIDSMDVFGKSRADLELSIVGLESKPPEGVDKAVLQDEIDAFRAGAERGVASVRDMEAALWAAAFDADQLAAMRKFYKSSGYEALNERQQALTISMLQAAARAGLAIQADARREYCRTQDCTAHRSGPQSPVKAAPSTARP